MVIKAIETVWNGYRFRSRVEARWAMFFTGMGIEFEYELEGFVLEDGTYYLPDFYLPQVKMWAEVKGQEFTKEEVEKCKQLRISTNMPCLMLVGPPDYKNYIAWEPDTWSDDWLEYDYSLVNRYLENEYRFPCMNYCVDGVEEMYCGDYMVSVEISRSARFEFGGD
jgi:hypothetical protein